MCICFANTFAFGFLVALKRHMNIKWLRSLQAELQKSYLLHSFCSPVKELLKNRESIITFYVLFDIAKTVNTNSRHKYLNVFFQFELTKSYCKM